MFHKFINGFRMESYQLTIKHFDPLSKMNIAPFLWINDRCENIEFTPNKNSISYIKDKSISNVIEKEMCKLFIAHVLTIERSPMIGDSSISILTVPFPRNLNYFLNRSIFHYFPQYNHGGVC